MRILFLTQWFQPEPFFKGLPFAKALRDKGHEVEVLTGFPNYPGGKVYPGYRISLHQQETMDGIKIHRVPLYPSHDKSAVGRIANYLSFSLFASLLGIWLIRKPDAIYVYNLVTLGLPAYLIRLLFGAKVIIDVQDLWPESVASSKMLGNKAILKFLEGICGWVYRKAEMVTVLSPGFKRNLIDRGVVPEKIEVIYNWCDENSFGATASPDERAKPSEFEGRFVVLFAGAMGLAQGLDTVLDCAGICRNSLPDVRFVLIGGGVDRPRLQQRAVEMSLDNVVFLPPRPPEKMGEIFALADALLVHLKDDPLFRITIPSKTQAYLYMGKPIVMAMRGDAADLVQKARAGVVCEPGNPKAMMDAIKALHEMPSRERNQMGEDGHRYYMENLSFNQGVYQFERIMMSLSTSKAA